MNRNLKNLLFHKKLVTTPLNVLLQGNNPALALGESWRLSGFWVGTKKSMVGGLLKIRIRNMWVIKIKSMAVPQHYLSVQTH